MYDKEKIYDEEIAPLMKQILEICKREKLPMLAQFYLQQEREEAEFENQAMYCTSFIVPEKGEILDKHREHLMHVRDAMRYGPNGKPFVMTSVIRTSEK